MILTYFFFYLERENAQFALTASTMKKVSTLAEPNQITKIPIDIEFKPEGALR